MLESDHHWLFRLLYKAKFLESRDAENPGKKGYQALNRTDYTFLAINAVSEPPLSPICVCASHLFVPLPLFTLYEQPL